MTFSIRKFIKKYSKADILSESGFITSNSSLPPKKCLEFATLHLREF